MKYKLQPALIPWRFYLMSAIVLLAVFGLIARVVFLTVFNRHFLLSQGDARALRIITEPAFRGMITDRNGYPLAISNSVFSVWVNPKEFISNTKSLRALADTLDMKSAAILSLTAHSKNKNREFVYLKRDISPEIAQQVKSLTIPGVYLQQGYKRYYPEAEIAAQVVGFTNVDDEGQEGVELAYNQWLAGSPGKKVVLKDRLGRVISNVQTLQDKKPGNDLVLSINRRIQYLAYRELVAGVAQNIAASGTVVVLDTKTGEILAMVSAPSFDPNKVSVKQKSGFRNRAVTDTFEPGSTIKSFSIATALASGKFKSDTIIDTTPGWLRVGHNLVRDEHMKGPISVAQVLQYSSNVGVTKIMLSLPPNGLWDLLHGVGFGESTGIDFPGEQVGKLIKRKTWKPFALATLAFGYGISVTPLQLAHAYATLANEGVKMPLSMFRVAKPVVGERVMDAHVAKEMLALLESVLAKGGTGVPARVPGYRVAGKTGTALMAGVHGYQKHRYVSSFVGIAPVTNPRLVVAVVIHDPQGKQYYGGDVSGPVFEKIMEGSLRILNISPDDIIAATPAELVSSKPIAAEG